VQLDVTWQSLRRLDQDYTVFVQALDATPAHPRPARPSAAGRRAPD
jgi:hypothetical protein